MELRLMSAQQQQSFRKEENAVSPSEYAKVRAKVAHFQSKVASLSEQLREARLTSMEAHLADQTNTLVVRFHSNSEHLICYQVISWSEKNKVASPVSKCDFKGFEHALYF